MAVTVRKEGGEEGQSHLIEVVTRFTLFLGNKKRKMKSIAYIETVECVGCKTVEGLVVWEGN